MVYDENDRKFKKQRASFEELGLVEPSQPSYLSPPVSQLASFLGEDDTEPILWRNQRCRSFSKDSEALEVAPVEPPTNLAHSPQPSTTISRPRSDSSSGLFKLLKDQPSAFSAKIPQASHSMPPPEAGPSLVMLEEREAMRSMTPKDLEKHGYSLLCQTLVYQRELRERISRLSADYAVSQAQETKLRSLAEYWEKEAKAIKAEKSRLSERMAEVLIELDECKAELEEARSKVEGVSSMLKRTRTKLEGWSTELQLATKASQSS
ncbi:uncharacterized protein LOC141837116 [Curcuma longa]|uniref:uncharacterized protein LOC141837116 n=1 Tax=Curcuma longa TaxID=136217 RepID=UPI003D9EBBBA